MHRPYVEDDQIDVPPLLERPSHKHDDYARPSITGRLSWLVGLMLFMVVTSYFVPFAVERIRYSWVRGRQRAEYETASEQLKKRPFAELSKAFQLVSQRVSPSVVHINIRSNGTPVRGPQNQATGQGSGVIVDSEGYILTNGHVIFGSDQIHVRLSDGRNYRARVVGVDQLTDLAVLKITARDLVAIEWGNSNDLEVGALVWAMGSPFGLESSITFGILSAKNRAGQAGSPHQDFLQTDAAVNPGNSGGPLVDAYGRLIGINTAIVGESYQGISFAVPSTVAKNVYERIKRSGSYERGWLGVQPEPVPAGFLNERELKSLGLVEARGAYVEKLDEYDRNSPARLAGIQQHDIIVQWGEVPINSPNDLFHAVADTEVGRTLPVKIIRDGQYVVVDVLVARRRD